MEAEQSLFEALPPDWKWQALFDAPAPLDRQWQVWLAGAQRAEDEALLRYWARRSGAPAASAG